MNVVIVWAFLGGFLTGFFLLGYPIHSAAWGTLIKYEVDHWDEDWRNV